MIPHTYFAQPIYLPEGLVKFNTKLSGVGVNSMLGSARRAGPRDALNSTLEERQDQEERKTSEPFSFK